MATRMTTRELLDQHGQTYAHQAGITLRDTPAPLFQLLVLTQLSSTRISADIAADAARELFTQGWRTPERLRASTWQQRVDALGRAGYRRYDESTADRLDELATRVQVELKGDLRRLRPSGPLSTRDLQGQLQGFPRIGPVGAGVFCREVQAVWPGLRPFFDQRARRAAKKLGWSDDPRRLADRVAPEDVATLAAALVRYSLSAR